MERVHPPLSGFPHFAPKAKSIIYLHMNGGPSQLDTWDYKPRLADQFDKDLPDSIRLGQRITTMTSGQARCRWRRRMFKFARTASAAHGERTAHHTAQHVDDIALIRPSTQRPSITIPPDFRDDGQ